MPPADPYASIPSRTAATPDPYASIPSRSSVAPADPYASIPSRTAAPKATKSVEHPKNERETPLAQLGHIAEAPLEMLNTAWEYGHGGISDEQQEQARKLIALWAAGKWREAEEQYSPNSQTVIEREHAADPSNPIPIVLLTYPGVRAAYTAATEFANPAWGVGGAVVAPIARGIGASARTGFQAARQASPLVARTADATKAIKAAANAKVAAAANKVVQGGSDKLAAAAAKAPAALRGVADAFGRYNAAQRAGGLPYRARMYAWQAARKNARVKTEQAVRTIFQGLTHDQKIAVEKLSVHDAQGVPTHVLNEEGHVVPRGETTVPHETEYNGADGAIYATITKGGNVKRVRIDPRDGTQQVLFDGPVPAPKPGGVTQPKGATLEERAAARRNLTKQWDAEQVALGLRKPSALHDSGSYAPMRSFPIGSDTPVPVWADQELNRQARISEQEAAENSLNPEARLVAEYNRSRARGAATGLSSTLKATEHKTLPPITDPSTEAMLHPHYDPAFQLEQHYGDVNERIANEKFRRSLEQFQVVDPKTGIPKTYTVLGFGAEKRLPQMARVPASYSWRTKNGTIIPFGVGAPGNEKMEKLIDRLAAQQAEERARQSSDLQAFAAERGQNLADYGRGGIRERTAATAAARGRVAEGIRNTSATGSGRRLISAVPRIAGQGLERIDKAFVPAAKRLKAQGARLDRLAGVLQENATMRAALLSAKQETRAMAQDVTRAYNAANRLARGVYHSGLGRDVDRTLQEIAEHRVRVGPVANPDRSGYSTTRTFSDAEITRVRSAIRKATGDKTLTTTDAERYLNAMIEKTEEARSSLEALVEKHLATLQGQGRITEGAHPRGVAYPPIRKTGEGPKLATDADKALADALRPLRDDLRAAVKQYARMAQKAPKPPKGMTSLTRDLAKGHVGTEEAVQKAQALALKHGYDMAAKVAEKATGLLAGDVKRVVGLISKADKLAAQTQTAAQFKKVYNALYKEAHAEVARAVRARSVYLPPGYELEADIPGLSSPSSQYMALHPAAAQFARESAAVKHQIAETIKKLGAAVDAMNNLSRLSVVFFPQVHAGPNLMRMALAEGVPLDDLAEVYAGRFELPADKQALADALGVESNTSKSFFENKHGSNATTAIDDRANMATDQLNPKIAKVAKPLVKGKLYAQKGYDATTNWLFVVVENGLAKAAFQKFIDVDKMTPEAAALRARNMVSRGDNITAWERQHQLNRIFWFYPWMKTVIPYWVKKGITDPKQWGIPNDVYQSINEQQGYDDRSKSGTITMGKWENGEWRRVPAPDPARVLIPLSQEARVPFDLAKVGYDVATNTGTADSLADTAEDLYAMPRYFMEHLNFGIRLAEEAGEAGAQALSHRAYTASPYNPLAVNRDEGTRAAVTKAAAGTAAQFLAPIERLEGVAQDPVGGLAGALAGFQPYGVKPAQMQALEHRIRAASAQEMGTQRKRFAVGKATGNVSLVNDALRRIAALKAAQDAAIKRLESGGQAAPSPAAADPYASIPAR